MNNSRPPKITKGTWTRMEKKHRVKQLLNAGLTLAAADHYRTVTHAHVAAAGDCSTATVFKMIGNKADLENRICRYALEQHKDERLGMAAHKVLLQMATAGHPLASHLRVELHHHQEEETV